MPFLDKSTLTYPATNSFPGRRWLDKRDPTSADFRSFEISDIWINEVGLRAWIMVDRSASSGTWIQMASSGSGILTITGDVGGAVGPDGANNINLLSGAHLTITGNAGTNTLTVTTDTEVATQFNEDVGSAVPVAGILKISGGLGINTTGAGNTATIAVSSSVPLQFNEDAGSASPLFNVLNINGGTGISTVGTPATVTISTTNSVATLYTCDSGSATPAAHNLNVIGGLGCDTSGAGSTVTINNTGGGIEWVEVTAATQQMAVNTGYIANRATLVTLTLPLTASQGAVVEVAGKGAGGWLIAQNAGQIIHFGSLNTTVGVPGSLASTNRYDGIEILCITANTDWLVLPGPIGNITVV